MPENAAENTIEFIFSLMFEKAKICQWKQKVLTNKNISGFAKRTIILNFNRISAKFTLILDNAIEKYIEGY